MLTILQIGFNICFCVSMVSSLRTFRDVSSHLEYGQSSIHSYSKPPTHLVIIKSHNPMPGMLDRMTSYAADLEQNLPQARLLISLDTSHGDHSEKITDNFKKKTLEIPIYKYDDMYLRKAYPKIPAWPPWRATAPNKAKRGGGDSTTKHFQTPSMALATKYAQQHFNEVFEHVWIVEDDVVVCGKFSNLMKFYYNKTYDLLLPTGYATVTKEWWHYDEVSDNFKTRYNLDQRVEGNEQLQRLSHRLLLYLDKLMHEDEVIASSEMFVPTVAKNDGFVVQSLDPRHVGPVYAFNARISETEASRVCEKIADPDVIVQHAGKW